MARRDGHPVRTTGPHFLVPAVAIDGDRAELTGDDARHLAVVLRGRPGDAVSIADGTGALWQGRIAGTGDAGQVRIALVERFDVPPPSPQVTVVHGLPKGRKLDEVVQRLTEVGVDRLIPVHTERSPVRLDGPKAAKAVARWQAIAHAAAKQSRRARLLQIDPVSDWSSAFPGAAASLTAASAASAGAVLWEEADEPLGEVMDAWGDALEDVVLAVGPEGGLTAGEVAASGLPAALLGDTILRTETAALVAASIALHRLGRLG
jgi:16S rRNA (uracil1498-N3)-methyltransferase